MLGIGAACLLAVLGLAAFAFSSGSSGSSNSSGCAILDVSKSTQDARPTYVEDFAKFATEIGNDGTGEICLVMAAADPLTETPILDRTVAARPENAETPEEPIEVEENVLDLTEEVAGLLDEPPVDEKGSGLVEAANLVAKRLHPGDRVVFLTDGFQWSKTVGHLMQMDLSAAGIETLIQHLRAEGLIPDLRGVEIDFPAMLYHPEGLKVDAAQENRVPDFWQAWADAAHATLTYETP